MGFLSQLVRRNWRLKLAAFGLAVFLWAVVRTDPGSTNTLAQVPVLVQIADSDWTLSGDPRPAQVEVQFRGSLADISRITRDGTFLRVPIDTIVSPDTVVDLSRDWVVTNDRGSVVVQEILPSEVRLNFERAVTRSVPLTLRTEGELPGDLARTVPLSLTPQSMSVRGPESRVEALDSIPVGPLDLSEVDESGRYEVALDTAGLSDLTFRQTTAEASIQVEPRVEQSMAGVPVVLASTPEGADSTDLTVEPSVVEVTLSGGRSRVGQAAVPPLRAVVPAGALEGMGPGDQWVVPIDLMGVPDMVEALSEVERVTVRWTEAPAGEGGSATGPEGGGR